MRPILAMVAILGFIALFIAQGARQIRGNAPTYDEAAHLAAGYSYLKTGDFSLNAEHPPLPKLLWALPIYLLTDVPFAPDPGQWERKEAWLIGHDFLYESPVSAERMLSWARSVTLGIGVLLIGVASWWTYRLWGLAAAVAAAGFIAVDPNLQAHSALVTNDVPLTLCTLLVFYWLWEYVQAPAGIRLTFIGVSVGLTMLCKFSALAVVASLVGVVGLCVLGGGTFAMPGQAPAASTMARLRQTAAPLFRIVLVALLTMLPAYFFVHFDALGAGLKLQFTRHQFGNPWFYLSGVISSRGWASYFPVAFALKTPLAALVAVALSLLAFRLGQPLGRREVLFLIVPAVLFFAAMMIARVNLGYRIILPVVPFLYIVASRLATIRPAWLGASLVSVPLLLTAWSGLRVAPHQLAYFNEAAGGPEAGWQHLADSNIDWGQDLIALKEYVDREQLGVIYVSYFGTAPPARHGLRHEALPGMGATELPPEDRVPDDSARQVLAVSVNNLLGVYLDDKSTFAWLRDRPPAAKAGYSIFIYDLTDSPEHVRRVRELAASERKRIAALSQSPP